ncbi:MAG TPA: hypothetical protein V6C84_06750 [Coleofasciculaceae cyanobacterium]
MGTTQVAIAEVRIDSAKLIMGIPMDKAKLAFGIVNTVDQEYTFAGVSVLAFLPAGFPSIPGAALSAPLEIGRAVTQADGTFELFLSEDSTAIAYACYLEHCHTEGIQPA